MGWGDRGYVRRKSETQTMRCYSIVCLVSGRWLAQQQIFLGFEASERGGGEGRGWKAEG